jgi:hypothetical protein
VKSKETVSKTSKPLSKPIDMVHGPQNFKKSNKNQKNQQNQAKIKKIQKIKNSEQQQKDPSRTRPKRRKTSKSKNMKKKKKQHKKQKIHQGHVEGDDKSKEIHKKCLQKFRINIQRFKEFQFCKTIFNGNPKRSPLDFNRFTLGDNHN